MSSSKSLFDNVKWALSFCQMGLTGNRINIRSKVHIYASYKMAKLFSEPVGGICGLSGVIHSYDLSKTSVADLHYMKDVKHTWMKSIKYSD